MKPGSLLALAIVLGVLAGCGSSSSSSSSSGPSSGPTASSSNSAPAKTPATGAAGTVSVTMKSLAFIPPAVTAKVGQTVVWVNSDTPPHNVTYVSGPKFASSPTMNTGAKFQIKLTQAGTIHYFCSIHPFMKATIVVSK